MSIENFPHLTLTQVVEVEHHLEGLTEVPVLNGMTLNGVEALVPRLLAIVDEARELEDIAERAGFPFTDKARQTYGSEARVYIQGPGAAQVRLDVSKKIDIVEYDQEDDTDDRLDFFEPDEDWEVDGQVVDLNARRKNPGVEVTE